MKINDSDLFYTCSLLELIGRTTHQRRSAVVDILGKKVVAHIYAHAGTLHCEPIAHTADVFIEMCHVPQGEFDNLASCKYEIPDYWAIGKVYARLVEDVAREDLIDSLFRVYTSEVSDMISNYNSDFFYQPRDYIKEYYVTDGNPDGINLRIPDIRFKGFTGEWEQRKLGELSTISKGKQINKSALFNYGSYYVLNGGMTPSGYTESYNTENDTISISEGGNSCGFVNYNSERFWSGGHNYTLLDLKIDCLYLYEFLKFKESSIMALRVGSGLPNIQKTRLQEVDIYVPKNDEQKIIGTFFRRLDALIALHERKCERLQNVKKSMLEKMFPKKGSNVPEIRFAGFSEPWEMRKLEDSVDFLDTQRKPLEGSKRIKGPYPYYGASGIVDYVDGFLFDEELVLLSEDGANITDRNYPVSFRITGKCWVNNHAHVLRTKKGYECNFICNSLERKDYTQYNTGMAMPKLNQEMCRNIPIMCPLYEEQQQIGTFFDSLDTLITLHQREIEKLKNIKNSMLEKMFV